MKEKQPRTFVREEAYTKIRDWIVEGVFPPEKVLRDKELAEEMGVSRTPIREALLRLEEEGLIQTKPNRSTSVSPVAPQDAFPLYSIVWTLEKLALSQAFDRITEQDLKAMIELNERLLKKMNSQDRLGAWEADNEFHAIYIARSQNKELEKIIADIKQKLKRLDLYYFDQVKDAVLSYQEHRQIIEAIKQRNSELAIAAVENNWKNSFARFER